MNMSPWYPFKAPLVLGNKVARVMAIIDVERSLFVSGWKSPVLDVLRDTEVLHAVN